MTKVQAGLPLEGVRVVELSHLIAAPYAGMLMADEGADVIKVEPPEGELSRSREPTRKLGKHRVSGHFGGHNRGKRSIALDLKTQGGRSVMQSLLREAHVFITNVRPAALGRLGMHPDDLAKEFPHLIVVIITGFGYKNAGEYEGRAGLAMIGEALTGATSLTRDHQGNPVWCGFALGDVAAGMTAHSAILLALRQQEKLGIGRVIDITLAESMLPMVISAMARVQIADDAAQKAAGPNNYHGIPYGCFRAADGHVNLGVNNDSMWRKFATAIGRPELGEDPRYALYLDRAAHMAEVIKITEDFTSVRSRAELTEIFGRADIPVGSILTIKEALEDDYFAIRKAYREVADGLGGTLKLPIDPTGFFDPDVTPVLPRLDEHRTEILTEYGFDPDQAQRLAAEGAFGPTETRAA